MRKFSATILLAAALLGPLALSASQHRTPAPKTQHRGRPDVKVWVNTQSGVYHSPGGRWYGATKQGQYMTQKEAQEKGYRPAYAKVCR